MSSNIPHLIPQDSGISFLPTFIPQVHFSSPQSPSNTANHSSSTGMPRSSPHDIMALSSPSMVEPYMTELDESPTSDLPGSSLPTSPCSSPFTLFQQNDETVVDDFQLENITSESLNEVMTRSSLKRPRSDDDADTVGFTSTSASAWH